MAKSLQSKRRRKSSKVTALDSDSDDMPLAKKGKGKATIVLKKPPKPTEKSIGASEDSDTPLNERLAEKKEVIEKRAVKEAKIIEKKESLASASSKTKVKKEAGDSKVGPPAKKNPQTNGAASSAAKKKTNTAAKPEDSDDDMPLAQKVPAKTHNAQPSTSANKAAKAKGKATKQDRTEEDQDAEDEEEEEYRWWEDPTQGDGTKKWTTLQHAGVVFPPPYEPLPKLVKMRYDGIPITMAPEAEEIAGFFGAMLNSTHNVENPTFQKNFFKDFQTMLKDTGGAKDRDGKKVEIKEFSKCDFQPIFEYYDTQRTEKKALSNAEKKALKAEKDAVEAPYMHCTWDGRKQKVGNFRVEPPALFRGRGEHPKTGMVKKRVQPEQIVINIGKEAIVPTPPEGHNWKEVKHDQEGTWLAMWQENINAAYKYVMLAANSDVKGQSDYKKFEKARELKVCDHTSWFRCLANRSETYRSYPRGLQ